MRSVLLLDMPMLRRALTTIAVSLVASPAAASASAPLDPHHIVVRFKPAPGAHAARVQPTTRVLRVASVPRALTALRHRRDVVYAAPDPIAHVADAYTPDDPGRGTTPGGWANVQWNFTGPFGVDAPDAWANLIADGHPGGSGVTIAVLDTGVAYRDIPPYKASPDLRFSTFVRGYDFVGHDNKPYDRNGHGTHVASTIAEATNNGVGLTGLAYGARIMPVKVLDDSGEGDASTIALGVRWAADHGAQVINLSLEFSTDVVAADIPELVSAIQYAHRKGALVIGASGNEAELRIAYPARAVDVMAVGATTEHGCLSDFSNRGHGLDVVAPGGGADAALPDDPNCHPDEPQGHDIYQVTLEGSAKRRRFGIPGDYEGTSMAVPHVSAIAALVIASGVLGKHPTPNAVRHRIEQTARDLGTPGYDTHYGYGLVNAAAATAPIATPATSSG